MRYFFDTEFIEDGKTIDLISIGMVAEDGREFYRCNADAQLHRANDWVRKNVFPHLPPLHDELWRPHDLITVDLVTFLQADATPEFWAYYADYDWVVLCQLFGRMIDLPAHFPKFCLDLRQEAYLLGPHAPPKPPQATEHDALEDARWNRAYWRALQDVLPAAVSR